VSASEHLPQHIIFVAMGAPGGIGRYEQLIIDALSDLVCRRHIMRLDVLCLAAQDSKIEQHSMDNVHCFTARGSKVRLLRAFVATQARYRSAVALFSHVNLTPLCLTTRPIGSPVRYAVMGYGIDVWAPLNRLRRCWVRQASVTLAISSYTAHKLVESQGVSPERVRLLPFGYHLEDVEAHLATPCHSFPSLLTVTRLEATEEYKGVDVVIRSLPHVVKKYPSLVYTVIGRGADRQRLQALAHDLGVTDHVHFRGFVPDDKLGQAYEACDVFVLPSKNEGFGIVYLEAMARAKPVVAARAGGVPDVVIDGQTGVLVEYGDVVGLSDALYALLDDAALRARLGAAGRERVATHFTYRQFVDRLCAALQILAEGEAR
jgi:phosphatidylinositol alpha-1,6-mannosyltransferase